MAITGVTGQGLRAMSTAQAVRAPAPSFRTAETASAPPASPQPAAKPEAEPKKEQVQFAVTSAEKAPAAPSSHMQLRVDGESKRIVAQIIDENNQVVKQIPPEEALKIAAQSRRIEGLLFDKRT